MVINEDKESTKIKDIEIFLKYIDEEEEDEKKENSILNENIIENDKLKNNNQLEEYGNKELNINHMVS